MMTKWTVKNTKIVDKQAAKLNNKILFILRLLFEDLSNKGPTLLDWPNYGKLHGKKGTDRRHCHLQKGRPTYVCCWKVLDKERKIIEVYYVGTHEKAPY